MEDINGTLTPWIIPYVESLLQKFNKSGCTGNIIITNLSSSLLFKKENEKYDVLMFQIPYAGIKILWQVMFDGLCKNSMPDFILHDNFYPDLNELPHLIKWDPENKDSLYLVVKELIKCMFDVELHSIRRTNCLLYEQIDELIKSSQFMSIESEQNTQILIQLSVDFQKIPDIHYKDAPPIDMCFLYPVLLVNVPPTFEKIVPTLHMSKRMEFVLGGQNSFPLPQYSADSMTLLEYTQAVIRNLEKMIDILVEGHLKRREYVAAILCQFESNVMEYDSENFSKASLLFSHQDFFFMVHVSLGRFFPHDQPKVLIQSTYHTTKQGSPFAQRFTSYPYSPRWSGTEMIKRLRSFLLENVNGFKAASLKNGVI